MEAERVDARRGGRGAEGAERVGPLVGVRGATQGFGDDGPGAVGVAAADMGIGEGKGGGERGGLDLRSRVIECAEERAT